MNYITGKNSLRGVVKKTLKPFLKEHRISFPDGEVAFPITDTYAFNWFFRYRFKEYNWHEPSLTQFILDLPPENKVLIDVGAHLGYFSIVFSRLAKNESYAIELDPTNYSHLERMVQSSTGVRGKVETMNLGISDHEFLADMPVTAASPMSSLNRLDEKQVDTRQVRVTSLDTFCNERGISPDIIKVDIEGFEWEFLKGCSETLDKCRPILIFEMHNDILNKKGVTEEDFVHALKDQGYSIFWFPNHRDQTPGELEPFSGSGGRRNFDIICKPNP